PMSIRHLKIFLCVVEHMSMSKAANALFISQPSVSQAIKEIEAHYSILLFDRLSKKLYLTPQGELLFQYASRIFDAYASMETMLHGKGQKPTLRIGATLTVGTCLLPKWIAQYEQNSTTLTQVSVQNSRILEQSLLTSRLDLGLMEGEQTHPDLCYLPLKQDYLVLVVGKSHPFYGLKQISLEDCKAQRFLIREEGSGVRDSFLQQLEQQAIDITMSWECTNTETLKAAAKQGLGIAIFSHLMVEEEVKEKTLHILSVENLVLSREIRFVFHKDKYITPALQEFMDLCRLDDQID
ncbi:MAG: LysR family transcriptional regulator, partial [Erysipelotrichaceae bacterium]